MSTTEPTRRSVFLGEVFGLGPTEGVGRLLVSTSFSPLFQQHRMRLILARVQAIALLFGILVPLWIFIDIQVFPQALWARLAVGRIIVAIAFMALAFYSGRAMVRPSTGRGYGTLLMLFLIPSLFFLLVLSQPVLAKASGAHLGVLGNAVPTLYVLLPLLFVVGVSLFPLTLVEGGAVVVPLLGVTATLLVRGDKLLSGVNGLAIIWVAALIGVVGILAAASQLQFMREAFKSKTEETRMGLLNRSGAEEWLSYATVQLEDKAPLALALLGFEEAGNVPGKSVLARIANELERELRDDEVVAWWDYGVLALVLPADCRHCVERIVHLRTVLTPRRSDARPVSFSVGLAEMQHDRCDSPERMIPLAEQRLRQARAGGGNRLQGCGQHGLVLSPAPAAQTKEAKV